jgi:suppressor of ftsI
MRMHRLAALLVLGVSPVAAQRACESAAHGPSRDLYCMELLPVPALGEAPRGEAELEIAPGPFTVAVTRDGVHRYRPRLTLRNLPAPAALDPRATTYVAWATTPMYTHWVNLGAVTNGTMTVREVALDQFVLVISAEQRADVPERTGPLVLRGGSPSTRLQPPDFQEFAVGVLGLSPDDPVLANGHDAHAGHPMGGASDSTMRWTTVPMPAGFAMLPAEMALRPTVGAQLPRAMPGTATARRPAIVTLEDGDTLHLEAGIVRKRIHGREHVLYAFNGQVPGPILRVARGTSVVVRFRNALDQPSTIHWHGLRHDWRMDGVPHLSQHPVAPGETFDYTLRFPDAGLYWYHPHLREEMQQDLGLSGTIAVRGMAGLRPVHREEVVVLDDILIGDDGLVPYGDSAATHGLMGRFGNVLLTNGEPRWRDTIAAGGATRLWLVNAANTRTFNVTAYGATLRLVAADMGPYPAPHAVESVVLAPAERYAVDVTPTGNGPVVLVNRVRALDHLYGKFVQQEDTLAVLVVEGESSSRSPFTVHSEMIASPNREEDPDTVGITASTLDPSLVLEFGLRTANLPFVTERMMVLDSAYFHPVEWSGTMPMMNWATSVRQAQWFVRDVATGKVNDDAGFTVRRGERRVLRLVNTRNTIHAMQHPIHLHGQRFVVLAVNGRTVAPADQAWKDTVLLPAGGTVDILVEFTNPGRWMLHCHIAEHVESGMMTTFAVEE